ncbi:MAG: hypothetical protein M1833_004399 [Piccolia ochrophora]|nr:MAG: hypothetical protein M1833_004399 [Piccolia ochrophora]
MESMQTFNDLPGIYVGEDSPLSQRYRPYTGWDQSQNDYWGQYDDHSHVFVSGTELRRQRLGHEMDSMQRFVREALPVAFGSETSQTRRHMDFAMYRQDTTTSIEPPSPYPRVHVGLRSPTLSSSDEMSATDRCSSTAGELWSPAASGREYGSVSSCHSGSVHHYGTIMPVAYGTNFPTAGCLENPRDSTYVNLQEVQQYPDTSQEAFSDDESVYDMKTEGGLEQGEPGCIRVEPCTTPFERSYDEGLGPSIAGGSTSPSVKSETQRPKPRTNSAYRRPRKTSTRGSMSSSKGVKGTDRGVGGAEAGKIIKRLPKSTQSCGQHPNKTFKNPSELKKHVQTQHTRPFICPFSEFSCKSTFGSKNEWKRHVSAQHLRLDYWRCDLGACLTQAAKRGPNDFNRKDLFTQHLRRMHCPAKAKDSKKENARWDATVPAIQERCHIVSRAPPASSTCGLCKRTFEGEGSWEERMEHVGRHYEHNQFEGSTATEVDESLKDYMKAEGLIEYSPGKGWAVVTTSWKETERLEPRGAPQPHNDSDSDAEGEGVDE